MLFHHPAVLSSTIFVRIIPAQGGLGMVFVGIQEEWQTRIPSMVTTTID